MVSKNLFDFSPTEIDKRIYLFYLLISRACARAIYGVLAKFAASR